MNSYNIEKRNAILDNWTIEEGSSMKETDNLNIIIDSMRESQIKLNQRNVSKVCRLYRGQLVDIKNIHKVGEYNIVLSNAKLSSWTKSLSSAALYSSPNGYQGSGHNKIPFVFHTKYNFNEMLGLDLECLPNYNYYPEERKINTVGDTCECYHEPSVLDKDREVIIYSSNFILNTNTLKLAFMNSFEEEIQLNISSTRILEGIADGSLFKNESWFRFLGFKNLLFYPQQLPEVNEKLFIKGYTEDMIANLHIYIRCTVDVANV